MLSLNSNVFHSGLWTALAIVTNSMDWKASCKLQDFTYGVDGSTPLYLLGCISVVTRLCCARSVRGGWVLTGFCRAVRLQRRRQQTWHTTTSARPSGTPSPSPSPPCWWGAGTPAPRWVPPPRADGRHQGSGRCCCGQPSLWLHVAAPNAWPLRQGPLQKASRQIMVYVKKYGRVGGLRGKGN